MCHYVSSKRMSLIERYALTGVYLHSYILTLVHSHALTFTHMHCPSPICSHLYLFSLALSFTYMHSSLPLLTYHLLHVLTFTHTDFFTALFSGVFTAELPECMQELMTERTKDYYQHFLPIKEDK